jgi:hypothetical protein
MGAKRKLAEGQIRYRHSIIRSLGRLLKIIISRLVIQLVVSIMAVHTMSAIQRVTVRLIGIIRLCLRQEVFA